MTLIQLGKNTFIPSDAKIIRVSFQKFYPKGIGTLNITYTAPTTDSVQSIGLDTEEDQETALKVLKKMAARAVNTTPEIDFWVDVQLLH